MIAGIDYDNCNLGFYPKDAATVDENKALPEEKIDIRGNKYEVIERIPDTTNALGRPVGQSVVVRLNKDSGYKVYFNGLLSEEFSSIQRALANFFYVTRASGEEVVYDAELLNFYNNEEFNEMLKQFEELKLGNYKKYTSGQPGSEKGNGLT